MTKYGNAIVRVLSNRDEMGKRAAEQVVHLIRTVLALKDSVNMVFAAAPSQDDFLAYLTKSQQADWSRIVGFQMDEYVGLPVDSGQLFSRYLQKHLFSRVRLKSVHLLDSRATDPERECARYAALLCEHPADIVCLGIGENGHIAFNDPPVADFHDTHRVKVIELDERDRQQQVNDGCFPTTKDVPPHAYTLTIPALMSATYLSCVVPTERKAQAVFQALNGTISTAVPATILRTHPNITVFLDKSAASLLL